MKTLAQRKLLCLSVNIEPIQFHGLPDFARAKRILARNLFVENEKYEKVLPYVLPLFAEENQLTKIVMSLQNLGVRTRVYHFDVNRDMNNPLFKKCIWLPVHEGINIALRKKIVEQINYQLSI